MNTQTQEALKMAINTMEIWNSKNVKTNTASFRINFEEAIQACKEALAHQEVGDAEIKQMLNDIEYYQKRVEELEQPLTRDWKETIDERIAKDDKFKEAIAQPAQEPVGYEPTSQEQSVMHQAMIRSSKLVHKARPAPAQEPVAWDKIHELLCKVWHRELNADEALDEMQLDNFTLNPLYTHPAPSWQGLSDDKIQNILDNSVYCEVDAKPFARAIEQALKEKNT